MIRLLRTLLLLVVAGATQPALAETPPKVIRVSAIGAPGQRIATSYMGILQAQGLLEKEFARDGVRIQWLVLDGAGPAQNEAIANGLTDFANYGILPNIIGRGRGLRTRILASYGYSNSYVIARPDLPIRSVRDLKGRTIGVDVGHVPHLALTRLLAENGVASGDVRIVAMKTPDALAALAARRIDATIGPVNLLSLVEQRKAQLVFSSKGRKTEATNIGAFVVADDFARRYPETTKRVAKAYLRAVHWAAQPANRERYLAFVARASNTPLALVRQDNAGEQIRDKANPLPVLAYRNRVAAAATFSLEQKLVRKPVDTRGWVDARFIVAAAHELGQLRYWPR
ncbi:ABC transporter substrate-binding protein [Sphingomonas desiccabilis]|nr:ABC transporter substrate-binding protein [Sphingomonas desiccabilis]MBB3911811.1 sulfonate transport system substrate-binding protein [Sphingomonas desiccabilis]